MMKNRLKYIVALLMLGIATGASAKKNVKISSDTIYVRGVVTDAATASGLQGVKVAAGIFSSLTDENGAYKVRVPSRSVQLSLSAQGYANRVVSVAGVDSKNITLYSETFVSVKNEKNAFSLTPSLTIEDELQTRFAGDVRSINRSATSAMGSNLFIRGYNSLNSNTQPLIVIDGTIWDNKFNQKSVNQGFYINTLADIDVNDIESVEIIKDAASLYGSKGANGVIVIKTNRGRSISTKIAFDASYGMNLKPNLPDVMNASQFRSYVSEVMKGSNSASSIASEFEGYLNEDPTSIIYNKYHNNHNWNDDVYCNSSTQHYGLNVQGGDDIAKYFISLGYTDAAGLVKATEFSRLNTRVNSDINLNDNFKVGTEIYFTQVTRELRDDGVIARTSPTFISQIKSPFLLGYSYTTDGSALTNTYEGIDDFGVSNPAALIGYAMGQHKQYRFGISVAPVWQINKNLTFTTRFSYLLDNLKEHNFSPMTGVSPIYLEGQGISYNTVKDQTISQNSLFSDSQLKYSKLFNHVHQFNAMIGYRLFVNSYKSALGEGHNTGDDKIFNLSNSLAFRSTDGNTDNWNSVSMYGQLQYTYSEKYNVWTALSVDASSRFGKKTKDGFRMFSGTSAAFPSVGASWLVSNESFMKNVLFINNLRVRAGIGKTGNDDIESIARYSYLSPVNYLGSAVGLEIGNLSNHSLQWETTTKMNAGIDFSVFDERLSLSLDVFKHTTDNLLTMKQCSTISGLDYSICNGGKLQNTGYELGLGIKAIDNRKFKWSTELTVSHYKNEIKALPDGDFTTTIYDGEVLTSVGSPAGLFYGYKSLGVISTNEDSKFLNLKKQNKNASYSYFRAGDILFDDVDSNGIINDKDKQVIGDPNPNITGSFSNRFTYGRLSLDVLCTYSLGNDVYNYQRSMLESMSNLYNQSAAVLNRWKNEGQLTDMPKATYGDPMGNSRFSDRWIEDGSYFKLKNVRLSYRLPVNSTYLEAITFWAAGANLYTWTKYLGSDPETSMNSSVLYQGIDNGLLSAGRSFYIGFKLNL